MGTLFIVSTPIGNLEDISMRALRILFTVDIVASEDTRRSGMLLTELRKRYPTPPDAKEPKLLRYDDHTELSQAAELIQHLENDEQVALVTDAGTPLISDPGYILVREARKRDIPVVSVPGPSAVITALSIAGLPTEKFLFLGYPPEKQSHRKKQLEDLHIFKEKNIGVTVVWYVAPHKLSEMLADMKDNLGDTPITIVRELTKIHESVWTGSVSEAEGTVEEFKGELVLLLRV